MEAPDQTRKCANLKEDFLKASENYSMNLFERNLGPPNNVRDAYRSRRTIVCCGRGGTAK
uniref:Uncharacterized protein n=1 Tax=Daphnia galeata TaxID=27404 RepID=A0A8J2RTL6_9CRUS|nr:unnamed protein product [Daphnia galeata]